MRKKTVVLMLSGMLWVASAMAQGDPAIAMGGRAVQGTVTAIAADKLTVKTQTGEMFQVVTSPNTTVRKGREPMKLADVHVGDGVGAMGAVDAPSRTVHALYLMVVDAEQIKKMPGRTMGKTYIAGKVTAIDELKLTILRADGVTQVIAVDEGYVASKSGGPRDVADGRRHLVVAVAWAAGSGRVAAIRLRSGRRGEHYAGGHQGRGQCGWGRER